MTDVNNMEANMAEGNNASRDSQGGPIIEQDKRQVKPYSKRIILFALLLIGGVIIIISSQAQRNLNSNAREEQSRTYNAPKRDFLSLAAEFQASAQKPIAPPPLIEIREVTNTPETMTIVQTTAVPSQSVRHRYFSNQDDRQAANQLRIMNTQAIMNPPVVDGFNNERGQQQQLQSPQQTQASTGIEGLNPEMLAALGLTQGGGNIDPNQQAQKIDFLRNSAAGLTHQGYSDNLPVPQQFYLELKAGTVIPGILMTGLNSDLPGPVMGQVSENVWDSARGRHVLIPKGTRILGVYDSQVTYGQKRILVIWNRLIFPNGTTLNIASSPGLDQSGYSGMRGRVDEHWGRMITAALLASLFVTGAEIISPSDNRVTGSQTKSPGEIASEQAANVILEMSAKLMDKNMNIQPTITIRPGRRFNIFVEKDIVFPEPYPMGVLVKNEK